MSTKPSPSLVDGHLSARRARLERLLQRELETPRGPELDDERMRHLLEQAEELYWNELAWEQLTAEEMTGGSRLVERMFPGLLAFVDGLLLRETNTDSAAPAVPRPAVVEEIARFLTERCIALEDTLERSASLERQITDRLTDLVLYRLHSLPVEGIERLDTTEPEG